MKNVIVTWDDQDDYCVAFFVCDGMRHEINIRKEYDKFNVFIQVDEDENEIIVEDYFDSLFEINEMMLSVFDMQINLPSEKLLEEIEGYVA